MATSRIITREKYVEQFPDVPEHMVDTDSAYIVDLFIQRDSPCPYQGGYLRVILMDTRKGSYADLEPWRKYDSTPFRMYVNDYDDYDREEQFTDFGVALERLFEFLQNLPDQKGKVEVRISFNIDRMEEEQRGHLEDARISLHKAGVTFDSIVHTYHEDYEMPTTVDWRFDGRLKGPVAISLLNQE